MVHNYFFTLQRIKLVDQQITESSDLLLNSKDFSRAVARPELLEEKITRILRGRRIGKVFVLRGKDGKALYQSENLNFLEIQPPTDPEITSVETDEQYVRVRNAVISGTNGLVLQVGVVFDRNFINWKILNNRVINYIVGLVVVLFIASAFLTLLLLAPLRQLISHLSRATSDLGNLKDVEPLPGFFGKYTRSHWAQPDEFGKLIGTVGKLIRRINQNHKLTKSWTLQMAHELKTPLAVISAVTESSAKAGEISPLLAKTITTEVKQMSETVNDFLDWAELESSEASKDLHSLKLGKVLRHIATRIENLEPGRLRVNILEDSSVFSNPSHLDQLITNIVMNALKYSPKEKPVEVDLIGRHLIVKDSGFGIPTEVIERLGEPFNVGPVDNRNTAGNGLGLAWACTVARLYGWELKLRSATDGTEVSVYFNSPPAE